MQKDNLLLYFRSGDKYSFEKAVLAGTRKKVEFNYKSIGYDILETETKTGYLQYLNNNFAIERFIPVWKSKNQPDEVWQKVEIQNHPVYNEGIVFSSFKKGVDIPLVGMSHEERRGVQRFEFNGNIHSVFEEYDFWCKGKIVPEKDKNLIVVLTEKYLNSIKDAEMTLGQFY